MESLMTNPIIWCIVTVCTVGGFLLALLSFRMGKKYKVFYCYKKTYELVKAGKELIPELDIKYYGKDINNLYVSRYIIWNSGKELIEGRDVVETSPLEIVVDGEYSSFLNAIIVYEKEQSNCFKIVEVLDKKIILDFEYAEPGDGFVIQLMHTGDAHSLSSRCKIKGGKGIRCINEKPKNNKGSHSKQKDIIRVIILSIMCGIVLFESIIMVLYSFGISDRVYLWLEKFDNSINSKIISVIFFALSLTLIGLVAWLIRTRFRMEVPQVYRKYVDVDDFE